MLLTKEVEVKYNGQVGKYYESKGYKFPREYVPYNHEKPHQIVYRPTRNSSIIVSIEDLNPNSSAIVEWKCDLCDTTGTTTYKRYLQSTKLYDGMKLCDHCRQRYVSQRDRNYDEFSNNIRKRHCVENTDFLRYCLSRDNYQCRICGSKENLQGHHLNSYKNYPELRYEPTNGITLCKNCHQLFHNIYGRYNFTKENFIKFSKLNLDDFINDKGEVNHARICYCYEDDEYIYNIKEYCIQHGWFDTNLYRHLKRHIMAFHHKHYFWKDEIDVMSREEIKNMVVEIESHRKLIRKGDFNETK